MSTSSTPSVHADDVLKEEEIWEFFPTFLANARARDPVIFAKSRSEAITQYNYMNHLHLTEMWMIMALHYLNKGHAFSSLEVSRVAAQPGAKILNMEGMATNQFSWLIASEFPQSRVWGFHPECLWPKTVTPMHGGYNKAIANFEHVFGESFEKLPFQDGMFDLVTSKCLWYQKYVNSDRTTTLKEIYRVLKPGGTIDLITNDGTLLVPPSLKNSEYHKQLGEHIDLDYAHTLSRALKEAGFTNIHRGSLALPSWGDIGQLDQLIYTYYRRRLVRRAVEQPEYFTKLDDYDTRAQLQHSGTCEAQTVTFYFYSAVKPSD